MQFLVGFVVLILSLSASIGMAKAMKGDDDKVVFVSQCINDWRHVADHFCNDRLVDRQAKEVSISVDNFVGNKVEVALLLKEISDQLNVASEDLDLASTTQILKIASIAITPSENPDLVKRRVNLRESLRYEVISKMVELIDHSPHDRNSWEFIPALAKVARLDYKVKTRRFALIAARYFAEKAQYYSSFPKDAISEVANDDSPVYFHGNTDGSYEYRPLTNDLHRNKELAKLLQSGRTIMYDDVMSYISSFNYDVYKKRYSQEIYAE